VCRFLLLFLLICIGIFQSVAQLPELNMQNNQTEDELNTVLGIMGEVEDENEIGFLLSLARNYYKLDKYAEAEQYYLRVINENICSDLDYKALAICLLNNNKSSLANEFYGIYRSRVNDTRSFISLWNQVTQARNERVLGSRVPATQYGMVYGNLSESGRVFLNLDQGSVSASIVCNQLNNMEAVMLPVEDFNRIGSFTEGPAKGSYIYSYQEADGFYHLFYSEWMKDKWKKPVRLELGEEMSHYIHPLYVASQNFLYFSSDKSGGHGGFDLYSVSFSSKKLTSPINLGANINTDKNELLPSIYTTKLTFASNGHPGFGGYDIYLTDYSHSQIELFPKPYNSSLNEFVAFTNTATDAIIIGGEGNETNILEIRKIRIRTSLLFGRVIDEDGSEILAAHVLFTNQKSPQGTFVNSDKEGNFRILLPDTLTAWNVEVLHEDYITTSVVLNTATLGTNPLIVSLKPKLVVEPEQVYIVNSPSKNVVPTAPSVFDGNSPIVATNEAQKPPVIFNEVGNDYGRYYVILGSARSYAGAYDFWQKWKSQFPNAEILEYSEKGIYRVGQFAGTSRVEAMDIYKNAKQIKTDVWILRPDVE